MVLLADAGWPAARIAAQLGRHYRTALEVLKDFLERGSDALLHRRRGPAPDTRGRDRVVDRLRGLRGQDRTWTSAQLAEALQAHGIVLSARQVRRYLRGMRSGNRRTSGTLKHKQDPAKAGRAARVLGHLSDRAEAGLVDLFSFDECGFAPSPPTGYSRCLPGRRKQVRYEYPQGRRINSLAAYRPLGDAPRLLATAFERTPTSDDVLEHIRALPAAPVPRVVVLDNAGIHVSKAIKTQRKGLSRRGIYLYFLPAYSPELDRIEPVFKQIKHHEVPRRSHRTKVELRQSVEGGFASYGRKLDAKSVEELRPAA